MLSNRHRPPAPRGRFCFHPLLFIILVVATGCAPAMPLSEGLVFAPDTRETNREKRLTLLEAGTSQSATLYTPDFARRTADERNLPDASLNASYRYGADLLGISVRTGDRGAVSLGLGVAPVFATDGNATVRLRGPYYLTVGAQMWQPYGILQRRIVHQNGYGLSAGVMYRRDRQWMGDFAPLNSDGNRHIVGSDVLAGRVLMQFPFSFDGRTGRLRTSLSVGPESRYGTIVTRFGLGFVFAPRG